MTRVELELHSPAIAIVELVGEHDLAHHELLTEALVTAAARRRHLLVDLSRCTFFDSTVVKLLLHVQTEITSDGGDFALVIPEASTHAARVVEVMNLTDILPVYASVEEALRKLEHVTRVRDLRERFGAADQFMAVCSCGWEGERRVGLLAMRHANADATLHSGSMPARPSR